MSKLICKILIAFMLSGAHVYSVQPQDAIQDGANETVTESGLSVRKGTIYATILNIRQFDQLIKESNSLEKSEKIEKIIQDINSVIPALESVKLFELFSVEEWLTYIPGHEGRLLVGLLYLQQFPEHNRIKLVEELKRNYKNFSRELQQEFNKMLLISGLF